MKMNKQNVEKILYAVVTLVLLGLMGFCSAQKINNYFENKKAAKSAYSTAHNMLGK